MKLRAEGLSFPSKQASELLRDFYFHFNTILALFRIPEAQSAEANRWECLKAHEEVLNRNDIPVTQTTLAFCSGIYRKAVADFIKTKDHQIKDNSSTKDQSYSVVAQIINDWRNKPPYSNLDLILFLNPV